ncbi:MAG: efflux RND transporter periplasmic adaptor subunit [Desulfobacterales bacterium]
MGNKKRIAAVSITGLLFIAAAGGLLWFFTSGKIEPGRILGPEKTPEEGDAATATATVKTVTQWYDAVGTLEPRTRARIEPRISAQVKEVLVNAGETVEKGELLVLLDDREMRSELSRARQSFKNAISKKRQAKQAVDASRAALEEAESDYKRTRKLYEGEAATQQQFEKAKSRFLQAQAKLKSDKRGLEGAEAAVRMARQTVVKAEIAFGYTEIKAPAEGKVLKRKADPGDMASPGKPLLLLRTARGLRLEAHVPETLVSRIEPGKELKAELSALDKTVEARVEEMIPYADPQTRTFLVRAGLPEIKGAYPGMYGKLMIPYKETQVILVPRKAVRRVGQLEFATVRRKEGWEKRYIKTGTIYDKQVEVLTGLKGDETLLIKESKNDDHR